MHGVCSNAPENCRLAASKKRLRADGDDPRCPECGSTLLVPEEHRDAFKMGSSLEVFVPVFGLLVVAASVFLMFHHHPTGGGGTENKYPAAGGPVLLRLSGDETIGQQLAPSLVEAWLETRGASHISQSAAGPQTPQGKSSRLNSMEDLFRSRSIRPVMAPAFWIWRAARQTSPWRLEPSILPNYGRETSPDKPQVISWVTRRRQPHQAMQGANFRCSSIRRFTPASLMWRISLNSPHPQMGNACSPRPASMQRSTIAEVADGVSSAI